MTKGILVKGDMLTGGLLVVLGTQGAPCFPTVLGLFLLILGPIGSDSNPIFMLKGLTFAYYWLTLAYRFYTYLQVSANVVLYYFWYCDRGATL